MTPPVAAPPAVDLSRARIISVARRSRTWEEVRDRLGVNLTELNRGLLRQSLTHRAVEALFVPGGEVERAPRGTAWSDLDILAGLADRLTVSEIAEEVGVSLWDVRTALGEVGLRRCETVAPATARALAAEAKAGKKIAAIARDAGLNAKAVARAIRSHGLDAAPPVRRSAVPGRAARSSSGLSANELRRVAAAEVAIAAAKAAVGVPEIGDDGRAALQARIDNPDLCLEEIAAKLSTTRNVYAYRVKRALAVAALARMEKAN